MGTIRSQPGQWTRGKVPVCAQSGTAMQTLKANDLKGCALNDDGIYHQIIIENQIA